MSNTANIQKFDSVIQYLCKKIATPLNSLPFDIKSHTQEIRLRVTQEICIVCPPKTYFLNSNGNISEIISSNSFRITSEDLNACLQSMCNYSVYSFQEQIANGFITIKGGNRVGICGTAVLKDNSICNIKNITSLNIRIAKEISGCSQKIFENIKNEEQGILIAGPPGSGKTTVLRDLARIISTQSPQKKVSIVDERCEIAGVFGGIPQFDVGLSDILTGFSKDDGILKAIRCLSPTVIVCDEIGSKKDSDAIKEGLNAGVQIIASIHARNLKELKNRSSANKFLESGAFQKIIFLNDSYHPGEIKKIYKLKDICNENNWNNNFDNIGNFSRIYSI